MVINGVALLAICTLTGLMIGELLGKLIGVQANVGGVGIAMLLLIFAAEFFLRRGWLSAPSQRGIEFWSAIYVPIVVGMAAQQNVVGAVAGGAVAILAGLVAVLFGFALVPLLAGRGGPRIPGDGAETPHPLQQELSQGPVVRQ
jgi:malonate transporter MadL subunit